MPATLRIADGTPVWISQAIIPSKDTVVSPGTSPQIAAVNVNSTDVFVYVNVENPGTVDVGLCPCSPPLPAAWGSPQAFSGFLDSTTQSQTDTRGAFTFEARPDAAGGDRITGPGGLSYPFPFGSGRRAWGWSPDGRMFAYVKHGGTAVGAWGMGVIALQPVTRSDGTTVPFGYLTVAGGAFHGAWIQDRFGWAGSQAVVAHAPAPTEITFLNPTGAPLEAELTVVCPLAGEAVNWSAKKSFFAGAVDWVPLVSPCGSHVAIVPRILQAGAPPQVIVLVETASAQVVDFRLNNAALGTLLVVISNPSITTRQAGAGGVDILRGPAATVTYADDPECTKVNTGVIVRVDRVKASTLPTANLGVRPVGVSAGGPLSAGQSRWVQVANASDWVNQSEPHWCLLAQAYTADGTAVPRPWFGDHASPPPFPVALENCAQRNLEILP
jgi:hypothetical protein